MTLIGMLRLVHLHRLIGRSSLIALLGFITLSGGVARA